MSWLVYQADPGAIWESLKTLGWRLPLLLVLPYAVILALDTLAWRVLFPGAAVPFGALMRARLAGEAVNLTTPAAAVGGEPLKAYLLRPWVPLSEGLAAVIVDKTTVVAGQGLFLLAGLGAAAFMLPPGSPVMVAMTVLLTVEVLAVGGFIAVQVAGVFGGGGRILGRFGLGPPAHYQDKLEDLDRRLLGFYRERRGRLLASTLLHGIAWAGTGLEIYLVLGCLGIPTSLATTVTIESFGAAVKFASFMIPASLGALDGGYVAFFGAFGLGGAVALSYTLVRRLREAAWALLGFIALASRPEAPGPPTPGP